MHFRPCGVEFALYTSPVVPMCTWCNPTSTQKSQVPETIKVCRLTHGSRALTVRTGADDDIMVIQNPHSQPFSYSFFITSSWRDDTLKRNSGVRLSYQDLHTQKRTFLDISNIRMWLFSFFQSNFCVENKQTAESKYPFINCLVAWVDVTKHFYQKCRQFLSKLFIPASKLKHSVNVGTRHVNSFLLFLHWSSAGLYGLTSCTKGGLVWWTHTIIFPLLGN